MSPLSVVKLAVGPVILAVTVLLVLKPFAVITLICTNALENNEVDDVKGDDGDDDNNDDTLIAFLTIAESNATSAVVKTVAQFAVIHLAAGKRPKALAILRIFLHSPWITIKPPCSSFNCN